MKVKVPLLREVNARSKVRFVFNLILICHFWLALLFRCPPLINAAHNKINLTCKKKALFSMSTCWLKIRIFLQTNSRWPQSMNYAMHYTQMLYPCIHLGMQNRNHVCMCRCVYVCVCKKKNKPKAAFYLLSCPACTAVNVLKKNTIPVYLEISYSLNALHFCWIRRFKKRNHGLQIIIKKSINYNFISF